MPESKGRKKAEIKKKLKNLEDIAEKQAERQRIMAGPEQGARWIAPTFITLGLLGVIWIVLYYIAGQHIPGMAQLGNWNLLIGMGFMVSSFIVATFWK